MPDAAGPPVFVISLAGSPRRARMIARLSALGVAFSIIDAVNGAALDGDDLAQHYNEAAARRRLGRLMSRGEIGCALSHRQAYRRMVDGNVAEAVILEDDAEVSARSVALWAELAQRHPRLGLVSLHAAHGFVWRHSARPVGDHKLFRAASTLSMTVAYLIRNATARKILARQTIDALADWPLDHRSLDHHLILPMCVGHGSEPSGIAAERDHLKQEEPRGNAYRIARLIAYLSFVPYLVRRDEFLDARNYVQREVAWRVQRHLTPFFIDLSRQGAW